MERTRDPTMDNRNHEFLRRPLLDVGMLLPNNRPAVSNPRISV